MTNREKEVLTYIERFIEKHRYAPTIREIAKGMFLTNHTVHNHVINLKRKGYIVHHERIARSIGLVAI